MGTILHKQLKAGIFLATLLLTISSGWAEEAKNLTSFLIENSKLLELNNPLKEITDKDKSVSSLEDLADASTYFITTWTVTADGESITIPTQSSLTYNYDVDWDNSGTWETGFTDDATHIYATAGTYTVSIRGVFPAIYFSNSGDKDKIQSIDQWGTIEWERMNAAFAGCSNLTYNAIDAPDLSLTTSLNGMFYYASAFDGDLSSWDVSSITDFGALFAYAPSFNGNISTWNLSNVIYFNSMFKGATSFNQDISGWNISSASNMSSMFQDATSFNQDISGWNVSNVTNMRWMFRDATSFNQNIGNWNVSNVTNMSLMFMDATSFNQDLGNWAVNNVTNMGAMFYSASSFNQNIGNWNVSNVTNMNNMFLYAGLSVGNYDALLNGWSTLSLQNGVDFHAGNSKYCAGAVARQNIIDTFGWTITDGGEDCGTCIDYTEYTSSGWSNGNPTNSMTAIFIDDYNTIAGSIDACSIEIKPGATVTVSENTTIRVGNDIVIDGDLVFLSSATGNGELAAVPGSSTITGDVTVQRYMQNKRSYRMVSSPVTTSTSIHDNWQEGATSSTDNPNPGFGTHITGSTTDQMNGFDGTITGNPSMFTVNVETQMFEAVGNTDTNTLTAGNPYLLFVRGDRSIDLTDPADNLSGETVLRATGSLVTGPSSQFYPTATSGDFVMFGNPYQSTVDVNTVFAGSPNINADYLYVYDPSLGDRGAYVPVSLPDGGNALSSTANQYLQPGQGAQVAVTGAATINFTEATKAPGQLNTTNATGNGLMSDNMLTVQLFTTENFNNGGPVHDGLAIIFGNGLDNAVTHADAVKPMNFYENLGINNNGTYLSIEHRELPQAGEEYALYSAGYTQSEYTLKLTVDGLEANSLYLIDHYQGTRTLLEIGENSYNFKVDRDEQLSAATDRFAIHTELRLGVNDNNLLSGIRLFPNPLNGEVFYINAPNLNGEELTVSISDLTGRSISEQALECRDNTVTVPMGGNVASGVYLVKLKHGGEFFTYRLIKE